MYVTQGTFSYLPALTDEQIKAQVQYCIDGLDRSRGAGAISSEMIGV